ncbi:flagellar motor switch protein FliN [Castellaniella sp.]|uniref:flagellar motor switch protein FliN n=1 Tax=Castellaniella sp. TaxID=1955812 RepID=UPI003565D06C
MSEPTAPTDPHPTQSADTVVDDDIWAAALAEQAGHTPSTDPAASPSRAAPPTPAASAATAPEPTAAAERIFQPLEDTHQASDHSLDRILDIPVELSVELGRTRLTLKNILQLGQGSVVELDGQAGEPMDIYINGYLIAQGEVVVVDDQYGVRITDIITPSDRLARINQRR